MVVRHIKFLEMRCIVGVGVGESNDVHVKDLTSFMIT